MLVCTPLHVPPNERIGGSCSTTINAGSHIFGHISSSCCLGRYATHTITYIYNCEDIGDSEERIRRLITQFAAINFTDLNRGDFEELLEECGPFVGETMPAFPEEPWRTVCRKSPTVSIDNPQAMSDLWASASGVFVNAKKCSAL